MGRLLQIQFNGAFTTVYRGVYYSLMGRLLQFNGRLLQITEAFTTV